MPLTDTTLVVWLGMSMNISGTHALPGAAATAASSPRPVLASVDVGALPRRLETAASALRAVDKTTNPRLALAAFGITAALNALQHRDSESLLSDFFTDLQLAMAEFDYPEVLRPELRARLQTVLTAAGEASERHHNAPLTNEELAELAFAHHARVLARPLSGEVWGDVETDDEYRPIVTLRDGEGTALAPYQWHRGGFEAAGRARE